MTINIDKKTLLAHFNQSGVFPALPSITPLQKQAAVLVLIIDEAAELKVLFTLRTPHLRQHAGQISFPGGMREISDDTLEQTALRETHEEIGLNKIDIKLLGNLESLMSSTQFLVTPFIGLIQPPLNLVIDTQEVAEIFTVPLNFLLDKNNQQKQIFKQNTQAHEVYVIEYEQHRIWGLTAKILVNLTHQFTKKR